MRNTLKIHVFGKVLFLHRVLFLCFSVLLSKKLKNTHNTWVPLCPFVSFHSVFCINFCVFVAYKNPECMENTLYREMKGYYERLVLWVFLSLIALYTEKQKAWKAPYVGKQNNITKNVCFERFLGYLRTKPVYRRQNNPYGKKKHVIMLSKTSIFSVLNLLRTKTPKCIDTYLLRYENSTTHD